jgi:hypothetical protein
VTLLGQVIDSPEVLTAIGATPHLKEFLNALYGCQYKEFFKVGKPRPAVV